MAPRAGGTSKSVAQVSGLVAKEVVRGVVDFAFKKRAEKGRRLGGSRSSAKKIEEGIKRVVEMGMEKVEGAGGMRKFVKKGISRIKKEGFMKVAEEVMNFASQGLVKVVNPPGFAAVFKANGACELVFRKDPLEGLADPTLQMEDLIPRDSPRVKSWKPSTLAAQRAAPVDVPWRPIETLHHNTRSQSFVKKETKLEH